jgi:outer membrane protein TolC
LEAERAADNLAQWVQKSEAARSQLAAILNLKSGNLGSLKDLSATGYKFGTPAEMLRRLQNRNPSLQALREKASAAAEATRLSRQERLPSFALGLNYIELDGSQSASANSGKDPWGLTLSVNLPIWQGKQRAAVQATRAHQRAIDATLRQRELELRGMLEAEISRHRDSLERMDRYTKHLIPLAEQSLEYSRNTYSTGQVGVLELLDSEQALLDLRLRYWGALADMHRAEASLLALIASHPEAKQPIRKHK